MRVAYVHDWLVSHRGGEKVLETLLELYPAAPVYTMFHDARRMPETINSRRIICPRGLWPFRRIRKALLPILPSIMESFPLQDFDLIISTSSCVAKGVIPGPYAKHLCYLHSPMRYVWDQRFEYIGGLKRIPLASPLIQFASSQLRTWDVASQHRVDKYFVNSTFVKKRTEKYYGRHDAEVLAPPIEMVRFSNARQTARIVAEPYFLAAGALVSYKRFDLAIEAAQRAGVQLVVAGDGPYLSHLRSQAGPKGRSHIRFEVRPNDQRWDSLLAHAEALIFPGIEDFGMIAIESMAAGTPVIAASQGGALDFIIPGQTGLLFPPNDLESLTKIMRNFRASSIDLPSIQSLETLYGKSRFLNRISGAIQELHPGA
ncbi:glycosyltransferase [Aureliella helgolandensis]|uniref:Glycogen synthase n=1 Tax=Aureliella helgolandensis TaxID=2527968 RepID=A0A518G803_9BACT|nr:glycosyltransferase [Aureliella helgolandensis]QDV24715.1 Glycogen synthase [Aureliella helgolandensis]